MAWYCKHPSEILRKRKRTFGSIAPPRARRSKLNIPAPPAGWAYDYEPDNNEALEEMDRLLRDIPDNRMQEQFQVEQIRENEVDDDEHRVVHIEEQEFEEESEGLYIQLMDTTAKELVSLYESSRITRREALALLQKFSVRVKLSKRALEFLLRILKDYFLPANNTLPRTIQCFHNLLKEDSQIEVVAENKFWQVFNIERQFRGILQREWSHMRRHMHRINKHQDHYDYVGSLYRNQEANTICACIYMDYADITKSTRMMLAMLTISITNLAPKVRNSVGNTVIAAINVSMNKAKWNEIMTFVRPQLQELELNGIIIDEDLPHMKFKVIEFIADTPARSEMLQLAPHNSYYSCPICTIKPEEKWELRTEWSPIGTMGVQAIPHLAGIIDLPEAVQCDSMHCTFIGPFKECMIHVIDKKSPKMLNSIPLVVLERFMEKYAPDIKFPIEFTRPFRSLEKYNTFKSSEWRFFCLYLAPIILPDLRHFNDANLNSMIKSILALSCATNLLHTICLKEDHIVFVEALLEKWHYYLGEAFGQKFYTSKAHAQLHMGQVTRLQGSPSQHNAFNFESIMGYTAKLQTHAASALKQIGRNLMSLNQTTAEFDPLLMYEMCTKQKRPNCNLFQYSPAKHRFSEDVMELITEKFNEVEIRCAIEIRYKHFVVQSRQFRSWKRNSFVIFRNSAGIAMPCLVELLFSDMKDEYAIIRELNNSTKLSNALSLSWLTQDEERFTKIQGKQTVSNYATVTIDGIEEEFVGFADFLIHRFAYQNCFVLDDVEQLKNGQLSIIKRTDFITKAFVVEYELSPEQKKIFSKQLKQNAPPIEAKKTYVMAMNNFTHD